VSAGPGPLICPSCARSHAAGERFCADCGIPLVHAPGVAGPPKPDESDLAQRARKIRPGYAEGPLVRVATARHQAEAELVQGLLLEEGIPSLVRRSGGFDVPDFLASGPRDVLVAAGGLDAAHEVLGDPRAPRRLPVERHPAWMRVLAFTLAITVIIAFAASVAVPFFD
jgi:hypothetical protein